MKDIIWQFVQGWLFSYAFIFWVTTFSYGFIKGLFGEQPTDAGAIQAICLGIGVVFGLVYTRFKILIDRIAILEAAVDLRNTIDKDEEVN